ncbi:hypothetical protein BDP27DRAFT_1363411 [Rhodocollybia butyracea]|uniref:Uncharacterized protein n=1 Tax=Rhodocollybia butyracea TaxID=206335 RepID=A0A9P5PP13_9AGAR|nr:hypothetical protein BDP27DRAFT_1363411 [Rhodocollybia butyracea]
MAFSVWRLEFEKKEWRVYCLICRHTISHTPYNAYNHEKTQKHVENLCRLSSSNTAPSPAIPINNVSDLALTRLMQTFSDPDAPTETLPPLSDFMNESSPQLLNPMASVWDELDELAPQFSGAQEADSIQMLAGYMLNIFEHGPMLSTQKMSLALSIQTPTPTTLAQKN